ncbi:PREDICTED: uncharacterized protein LOC107069771 [Polistes dominula]|uniref:phospholipase A1 n=1 Tax=Polistes dominula TaxID=743375 RepID=A0ABM1IRK0_POLDO|nr:PREDICTED: uncharacterized protein LOC107069771 [Polistes dominula]
MIYKTLLILWILRWISFLGDRTLAQAWPTSLDESLDEKNDAEIFRAVVESMREWSLHKRERHRNKREVSKVCYEDVGCFEDTGPFSYLEMLPSPPKDVGTRFLVYGSRKARSIPMEVPAEDINDNAHRAIDPDLPTKVIVHGFGSSCDHVWVYEMRLALMTVQECNIVCVDWGPGSAVPNYVRAAANTRLVGRQLAKLIRNLEVPQERVHLIGFSLGAHVAGFAGAELGNVSRITGLDPAGPLFESQDPRARLDETDANFVDVIHSNGEQLILGGLGSWQPMGDVDFYPNGGRMQTGCSNLFVGAVSDIIWSAPVEGRSLCNHRRAYKLFTDSVSPKCRFPAFPCPRGYDGLLKGECFPCNVNGENRPCGDMGYYSDKLPARGQLYLITRDEEPFCAHQYKVKVYNSRGERPTRSYGKLQITLIGEGSFNESFAMTRKDEELLVGVTLQKIVVPHPAVNNIQSIEIKYTAYSGWLSSGLVTWSIDKVALVDSFGKTLSICKNGLILESGRTNRLPLYPGDCEIPVEGENVTNPIIVPLERMVQERQGGFGPFTKDQNYDFRNIYSSEFTSKKRTGGSKGVGPFTRDQNIRLVDGSSNDYENSDDSSGSSWKIVEISNGGESNSLDNGEIENGRSFSGSNFIQQVSTFTETTPEDDTTTKQYLPEIREPVLRSNKKESGRSLKLSEITEPILRPRSTRQNLGRRNTSYDEERQDDEIQETSSTSTRGFTVQFLPERLAGILAQAEKYARQTLLPLISQYTPSFVSSFRQEEPKYFPPLGDRMDTTKESFESTVRSRDQNAKQLDLQKESVEKDEKVKDDEAIDQNTSMDVVIVKKEDNVTIERNESDEWVPIKEPDPTISQRNTNLSRSFELNDEETITTTKKSNDWVPIIESTTIISSDEPNNEDLLRSTSSSMDSEDRLIITERSTSDETNEERKFIPLIDLDNSNDFFPSTSSNDLGESRSTISSTTYPSHIQKIPRSLNTSKNKEPKSFPKRTMMFPYAYERRKDPRTRYIPLIPEEDLGRSITSIERDR